MGYLTAYFVTTLDYFSDPLYYVSAVSLEFYVVFNCKLSYLLSLIIGIMSMCSFPDIFSFKGFGTCNFYFLASASFNGSPLFFLRACKQTSIISLGSNTTTFYSCCYLFSLFTNLGAFLIAVSLTTSTLLVNTISSLPLLISFKGFGIDKPFFLASTSVTEDVKPPIESRSASP